MLIRAPRNNRELFELFRLHGATDGIEGILAAIDFAGVGAGQIHYAAFNRLLDAPGLLSRLEGYDAKTHLKHSLNAEGFQKHLLDRLLAAYPEKRRLLLVHVPKCAGSDLTVHLMERFPAISHRIVDRNWMPPPKMHGALKKLVQELGFSDRVFVHGHIPLSQYLAARHVRFGDELFTVLRDPAEMVVSKINYVITRFGRDPAITKVDTTDWASYLNRETIDRAMASGDMLPLAHEILHSKTLIPNNMICTYLGTGDAASAFSLCAQGDIEITETSRYQRWLLERWGVQSETRHNASVSHVSVADFGAADMQRMHAATAEDRKIFDALNRALDASGTCAIRGMQLARQAG